MSAQTDNFENKYIDWLFRAQALGLAGSTAGAGAGPAKLYISLKLASDSDAMQGTEVSGGGYARVEVVSSLERDGRAVFRDLRWGVYVTFRAPNDYVKDCFAQYGLRTDASGVYASMYKPYHLIGLELGLSVANIAVRGEATGATRTFAGDVAATAKRDLKAGEKLDGEGGYMVHGRLVPAAESLRSGTLPIGLAHGVVLQHDVAAGQPVRWSDIAIDESYQAIRFRREMEALFRAETGIAA